MMHFLARPIVLAIGVVVSMAAQAVPFTVNIDDLADTIGVTLTNTATGNTTAIAPVCNNENCSFSFDDGISALFSRTVFRTWITEGAGGVTSDFLQVDFQQGSTLEFVSFVSDAPEGAPSNVFVAQGDVTTGILPCTDATGSTVGCPATAGLVLPESGDFQFAGGATDLAGVSITDFFVRSDVPEPATSVLFGLGLVAFGISYYRKRANSSSQLGEREYAF